MLKAQSGRRRTEPSSSPAPNTERPRRTTPNRPAENAPGQPATPDAPGTNAPTTPAPANNAPQSQTGEPAAAPADGAPVEIDDGEVVRVTSNLVPVSATVTDTRGKAITDLTVEDFELRVDGQPKPIGGLSQAETPVRMVMLFDNSDSIRSAREFEKQAAIRFFKRVLRPVDQAAIYSVGTIFEMAQPLTNDVQKLVRTIENFDKPEGITNLFGAMAHAAEYLRLSPGRKILVLVTDGADTANELSYDETLRRMLAADCQVYAVQTGIFESANLYDLMAVRRLETFADRTGGTVYIPKSTAELDVAFAQISADLAQQYVLSYYPTDEGRDRRFRVINLRVKTRPNLRVRARRGYYPRGNAAQLSPSSERFASMNDPEVSSSRNPAPAELDPRLTVSRELASNVARSTIKLGGPVHGSKNMNHDTSGDAPTRAETDVRVSPMVRPSETGQELKTAPQSNETPTEMKLGLTLETKPTPVASLTPEASTDPTPTRSSTISTAAINTAVAKESKTTSLPSSQDAAQSPISVGQLNAKAVALPKPVYPDTARRMRIEGEVRVSVLVDESGRVVSARAENGHALLREAAVVAARQAKFTPSQFSGQPVRVSGFVIYNFKL